MMKTIKSFGYAWQGIIHCFFMEMNFKIHVVLAFITILCSYYLKISTIEWVVIILCMVSVLVLEMLNTTVERICNKFCPQTDPQIKIIKDVAAGAVLVAAIGSTIIGTIIFLPKLLTLLSNIK